MERERVTGGSAEGPEPKYLYAGTLVLPPHSFLLALLPCVSFSLYLCSIKSQCCDFPPNFVSSSCCCFLVAVRQNYMERNLFTAESQPSVTAINGPDFLKKIIRAKS